MGATSTKTQARGVTGGAGNSLSESPVTLGSSEMSFQANGVMLNHNKLGDQFLVRLRFKFVG
jgi:hypothetical protein